MYSMIAHVLHPNTPRMLQPITTMHYKGRSSGFVNSDDFGLKIGVMQVREATANVALAAPTPHPVYMILVSGSNIEHVSQKWHAKVGKYSESAQLMLTGLQVMRTVSHSESKM